MRFRKSFKVAPGVRLNLSKSGVSTSFGGRGATVNVGKQGIRSTLSVPGTGLSWSRQSGWAESKTAHPSDEIENLRKAATKAIATALKEAEKVNAIGSRIDRAIVTLNGGRGISESKAATFEKRVLSEEEKLGKIEENVHEQTLFLDAIEQRLSGMQFGLFGGANKRQRDRVVEAVQLCAKEAKGLQDQIARAHEKIADKLSEVQDALSEEDGSA